jgi:hypothetical protein
LIIKIRVKKIKTRDEMRDFKHTDNKKLKTKKRDNEKDSSHQMENILPPRYQSQI